MERLNHYREILDCLQQPSFLTDGSKILLQNPAAESAAETFVQLLNDGLPEPPAVVSAGTWNFRVQALDGFLLVLAEKTCGRSSEVAAVSSMRIPLSEAFAAAGSLMPAVEELEDDRLRMQAAKLNRGLYQLYRAISNYDLLASGAQSPKCSRTDLCSLIRRLEMSVPQPCSRSGVTLTTDMPERPVYVYCDPQLLEVALLNLLSNAIRFAEAESSVVISVARQKGRAIVTVRNTGAPADLSAVFGSDEAALLQGKAGVGLELVRKIATRMGGTFLLHTGEQETKAVLAFPASSRGDGELRSPVTPYDYFGGFDRVLLELSDVLPPDVFLPEALE